MMIALSFLQITLVLSDLTAEGTFPFGLKKEKATFFMNEMVTYNTMWKGII